MFGLGFVLSFGYWTTNFVEVQRAMASDSISSARKTPVIGAFPKMFVPFITILPGMIAAVLVTEIAQTKAGETVAGGSSGEGVTYNDSLLFLMRDVLPNGLLGLAITGLLAAFMAGMAANISAFNTVFSYDLWSDYIVKGREDGYYLRIGRYATVAATVIAIFTASLAASFSNIMSYLQTLFGFFNAPLFATFILGMFWKRMTPTAAWMGLVMGTVSAVAVAFLYRGRVRLGQPGVIPIGGQGAAFLAASVAFVVDIVLSIGVSLVTKPKPADQLVGLVYSETPARPAHRPERGVVPLVPTHRPARRPGARHGHRPERRCSEELDMARKTREKKTAGALDVRNIIGALMASYGVILLAMGLFGDPETDKTGGVNANLWAGLALLAVGGAFLLWARLRPVVVPDDVEAETTDAPHMGGH